jgi:hypothetical protein
MFLSISATLWEGWMVMDGLSPSSILVKVAAMAENLIDELASVWFRLPPEDTPIRGNLFKTQNLGAAQTPLELSASEQLVEARSGACRSYLFPLADGV